jgi:hypothetical protein
LVVFRVIYRGYRNRYNRLDRPAGVIAVVAAIGVVFFPTGPLMGWRSLVSTGQGINLGLSGGMAFSQSIMMRERLGDAFPRGSMGTRGRIV